MAPLWNRALIAKAPPLSLKHASIRSRGLAMPATYSSVPGKESYRSGWHRTDAVPLTRESFLDLLYGRTPTICERGFVDPETSWKFEKELSPQLMPYKHNTGPLLTKVGVAQFEYQAQAEVDFHNRGDEQEQYFIEAEKWMGFHEKIAEKTGLNLWKKVFTTIASLFPEWEVKVAEERPGRKYYSGIFRALNDATHVHCDWSPYDSLTEDWIINKVENQVVFNLYLAPVKGGRTIVHDVHWTEDVLKFRDPASYGYSRDLVEDSRRAYVTPEAGALCFFNSRNMHEVQKVDREPMPELDMPYRPRLTLSSFMGLLPPEAPGEKQKLIFWS